MLDKKSIIEEEEEDMANIKVSGDAVKRTGRPNARQQLKFLVVKQLRVELQKPGPAIFRTALGALLMILYGFSFLSNYDEHAREKSEKILEYQPMPAIAFDPYVLMNGNPLESGPPPIEWKAYKDRIWYEGDTSSVDMDAFQASLMSLNISYKGDLKRTNFGSESSFKEALENAPVGTTFAGIYVYKGKPNWEYGIYINGTRAPKRLSTKPADQTDGNSRNWYDYMSSGMVGLQQLVDQAIIKLDGVNNTYPYFNFQRLPKKDTGEELEFPLNWLPGFYVNIGMMFTVGFYLSPLIAEQRKEIVRAYVLMGVRRWVYWFHWVATFSLFSVLTAILYTITFIFVRYAALVNPFLCFLSFFLLYVHLALWAIFVPNFIKKDEVAAIIPFMFWLFSSGTYALFINIDSLRTSMAFQSILTVLNPFWGAFQFTIIFVEYDWIGYNVGVTFSNAVESGWFYSFLAQIGGIVLYSLLAIRMLSPRTKKMDVDAINRGSDDEDEIQKKIDEQLEPLPDQADVLLNIVGLRKYFKVPQGPFQSSKVVRAVDGLNMQVCRGEIYGFLGHNGSGKSTSIGLLSGELLPDAGMAEFNFTTGPVKIGTGNDDLIRSRIGVCPQHDILFENLTTREHLELFAKLKGGIIIEEGQSESEAIKTEVEKRMEQLKFTSEEDAGKPVGTFSGGMKRKVSIAISLLGDPEVVFLDEPTASMDPLNRRIVWEMIQEAKVGKSIVLTTHFMDEADILSDRIGILNRGKLVANGTSLFLKHKFGAGYELSFQVAKSKINSINDSIKKCIPQATFDFESKKNAKDGNLFLHWSLPFGLEASFPKLLNMLDTNGCLDVRVELTTLEQVFLKTGAEENEGHDDEGGNAGSLLLMSKQDSKRKLEEVKEGVAITVDTNPDLVEQIWNDKRDQSEKKTPSFFQRIKAVAIIVGGNSLKEVPSMIFGIFMPLGYLIAAFAIAKSLEGSNFKTPKPFDLNYDLIDFSEHKESIAYVFGFPPNKLGEHIEFQLDKPENVDDYFKKLYLGGYDNFTLSFNSTIIPSVSIMVTTVTNQVLQSSTISSVKLVPLPYNDPGPFPLMPFLFPMFIGLGFMPLGYIIIDLAFLKEYKLYTTFRVMGIDRVTTYVGVALYKMVTGFLPFFLLAIILAFSLQNPIVGSGGRWLGFILLMTSYAFAVTPFGMMFEPLFPNIESAKNWFPFIFTILTVIPFIVYSLVAALVVDGASTAKILGDVLSIIPPMAFQRGFQVILQASDIYEDPSVTWETIWGWDTRLLYCIVMLNAFGAFFWIIVSYQVYLQSLRASKKGIKHHVEPVKPTDEDVIKEREYALQNGDGINARDIAKHFNIPPDNKQYKYRYLDLGYYFKRLFSGCKDPFEKEYGTKEAVRGMSFAVKPNELFVLLGPNGAGKSVSMKMLTSDFLPDCGEIVLDNHSDIASDGSSKGYKELYQNGKVSYCPQHDSIFENMTVLEHLDFAMKARGMKSKTEQAKNHIHAILEMTGLDKHAKKLSKSLSGGYKRKLCFAMALVGYPDIMLLDEISSGMDPGARHQVWSILKPEGSSVDDVEQPAILLSTHYMDEAEYLATRVGIMIDGEMVTTGSVSRLEEKHCNKTFAEFTLQKDCPENIEDLLLEEFNKKGYKPTIYESMIGRVKIQMPLKENQSNTQTLASLFTLVEAIKDKIGIEYYSISQMNLEQIFIELSRKQFEIDNNQENSKSESF